VIYSEMIQRLDVKEDEKPEEVRREFDSDLGVIRWQSPGGANKYAEVEVEEGAPSWWAGDEEASQGTLASMRAMGAKI
jgi:hypothetical protein